LCSVRYGYVPHVEPCLRTPHPRTASDSIRFPNPPPDDPAAGGQTRLTEVRPEPPLYFIITLLPFPLGLSAEIKFVGGLGAETVDHTFLSASPPPPLSLQHHVNTKRCLWGHPHVLIIVTPFFPSAWDVSGWGLQTYICGPFETVVTSSPLFP